jgi:O-antigen ligase
LIATLTVITIQPMGALRNISCFLIGLYSLVVLTIFLSIADQPLGRLGYLPINPTLFAFAVTMPFVVFAFMRDVATGTTTRFLAPFAANGVPFAAFFVVAACSLLLSILPGAFWNEGGKWIFLIFYGFSLSIFALYIPQAAWFSKLFPYCGLSALFLLAWSIYIDITYPGTFAALGQRPAGFPGNANFASLVAVMICAATLEYRSQQRLWRNVMLLVVTGTIVVTTMSRSGGLNFLFLVGIFSFVRMAESGWRPREILRVLSVTGLLGSVCAGVAIAAIITGTISEHSRLGRLMSNKQVDDGSTASRLFAVRESLRLINDSPILGHGTGHSRTMRELPHNLYLQQWVNNGIAGILGLVSFFGVSLYTFIKRRYRPGQALMLVAMLGGVFSHNILDQRCFLLLYGILLGLSCHTARPAMARYSSAAFRAPYTARA